ncbi:Interleukin-31 Receptor Subunit Alpha [Manis pentadactyla]|nr:Interleukin-31 Receptor Subunit Alpha [Manis pentadactyla]
MLALGTAFSAVRLGTSAPAQPRLTLGSRQPEPSRPQGEKSEMMICGHGLQDHKQKEAHGTATTVIICRNRKNFPRPSKIIQIYYR